VVRPAAVGVGGDVTALTQQGHGHLEGGRRQRAVGTRHGGRAGRPTQAALAMALPCSHTRHGSRLPHALFWF
jgi:hypothetical protein